MFTITHAPRALALAAVALGAASVAAPAPEQSVNTQPLVSKVDDSGVSGELRGSLDWRTGNVDLLRASSGLLFLYRDQPHTLISSSELDFGSRGGDDFLFKVFSHLRYQIWISDLVTWETFGQVTHDRFKRLTLRALGGTGPRFALIPGPLVSLHAGVAYMFEHERYSTESALADSDGTEDNHRLSSYLSGRFQLDAFITFVQTIFYQPRFDAFIDDFRVHSETQLVLNVAERLALSIAFSVAYDSAPPETIEGLDTTTIVSLAWGF